MLTTDDLKQLEQKGIDITTVEKQIDHFIKGFPFINLDRPALVGDGIMKFDEDQVLSYSSYFDQNKSKYKIIKFVPASGAASRMFKHLFEFSDQLKSRNLIDYPSNDDLNFNSVFYFLFHLPEIAFYQSLKESLNKNGFSIEDLLSGKQYNIILDYLLGSNGLDYANLPKALLLFHDYQNGARTSAEEHLVEAATYAMDENHVAHLHFTISQEHREKFQLLLDNVLQKYEALLTTHFEISFSYQKPSTDTIAVNELNEPFRNYDGTILFRPGGHGALIDNLNDLTDDIIFIKNIDNIVPDRLKDITYLYKKALGGLLLSLKLKVNAFLLQLENDELTASELGTIAGFARESLQIFIPEDFFQLSTEEQKKWLFLRLNRPMRVCGMVKNEGEPGGGPFWVENGNKERSLQIVESSQVDFNDLRQVDILKQSTHFNPVDLVCAVKDHHGQKYDLKNYIDENTGFISIKSAGGKTLKAQELPGLWNGAMASWTTLFVEVPIITFNPVKTINDLLRKEHLPT